MNFDFSSEQKMLRDQVARVLAEKAPLSEARRCLEGAAPYSKGAWEALAQLGVLGAAIPEAYGGLGMGRLELCVAAEEIGRALAPVPFLSSIALCAEAILECGSEAQKQRWLPGLASGQLIGVWAVVEDRGEFEPEALRTVIRNGRITGVKRPVADGAVADIAVVLAVGGAGPSLALVDLSQSGVTRMGLQSLDPSRPLAELRFEDAPAEGLGPDGEGAAAVQRITERAAVLLAFEQVGGAERALYMARDYALQRQAFGHPIGRYQAIKHKLANIYMRNEIARVHAYWGAWAISTDAGDTALAAASARVSATEAFALAAQENIQTHGGIGFTWESDCHLLYRRARATAVALGSVLPWKERLVGLLELRNAA